MKALGLVIAAMAAFQRYIRARTVANLTAYLNAYQDLDDESHKQWAQSARVP